jgi:hypothetical protein
MRFILTSPAECRNHAESITQGLPQVALGVSVGPVNVEFALDMLRFLPAKDRLSVTSRYRNDRSYARKLLREAINSSNQVAEATVESIYGVISRDCNRTAEFRFEFSDL